MPSVNTVPKENIRLCDVTEETPTSFSVSPRAWRLPRWNVPKEFAEEDLWFQPEQLLAPARDTNFARESPELKKNELVIKRRTICLHWRASWTYTAVLF